MYEPSQTRWSSKDGLYSLFPPIPPSPYKPRRHFTYSNGKFAERSAVSSSPGLTSPPRPLPLPPHEFRLPPVCKPQHSPRATTGEYDVVNAGESCKRWGCDATLVGRRVWGGVELGGRTLPSTYHADRGIATVVTIVATVVERRFFG